MRRDVAGALRLLVVPTVALVAAAVFVPGRAGLAVRIYALVVCGTALALALLALRRTFPTERPSSGRGRRVAPRRRQPSSLERIELEAALGVAGAFDLHFRLVPRLRSIAGGLLESRRRISLEAQPQAGRDALGATTWELVRPDRQAPEDRLARGITPRALGDVVDSLEAV